MSDLQKALEREKVQVKDMCSKLECEKMNHKNEMEKEQRLSKQLKTSLDLMEVFLLIDFLCETNWLFRFFY